MALAGVATGESSTAVRWIFRTGYPALRLTRDGGPVCEVGSLSTVYTPRPSR